MLTQYKNSSDIKFTHISEGSKSFEKHRITEKWQNYEISNYEYIMKMNLYSGRSFNDLS
ncbi:MAG: hypothetical protein IPK55_11025 [Streptococcus sp.]|nr:hypothetical protein [Streptococcus sp.]